MKLLVVGAGGMLGQDVVRAAEVAGHPVVALPRGDLDVTDRAAVDDAVVDSGAEAVVNCAAYTNVDGAEEEPDEAMRVNADGAGAVAGAAARADVSVLYVSSDYVFDGREGRPYVESDDPSPLSSYGRSKLAGERETVAANPRHHVVRTSWLFGAGGGNFVETMLSLGGEREELNVVRDQVGAPTYTAHLAHALLLVLASGAYGIHHVTGAGSCSWCDFAREIFSQAAVRCRIIPCTTDEFPRPATRPAYSVLAPTRAETPRLPHWKQGLESYLMERRVVA